MALFSFMRRKKKVALLISLPQREEFLSCRPNVEDSLDQLQKLGVDVAEEITPSLLARAANYDVLIIVAHYAPECDALELASGMMPVGEFVSSLPMDFRGVLDFSSCYSAASAQAIKQRCPDCHVQGALRQITLTFRMAIYPTVIKLYLENGKKDTNYHDVFTEVMTAAGTILQGPSSGQGQESQENRVVKLGGHESSVYAPSQVERGQPFLVQVFFHKDKDSDAVMLTAQRLDPGTGLMETQILPVKLKMRDKITVNIQALGIDSRDVDIDSDTKSAFWMGAAVNVKFAVTVNEDFEGQYLMLKLLMEVNRDPVGECIFRMKITDKVSNEPVAIAITPYDKNAERGCAKKELRQTLQMQKEKLDKMDVSSMTHNQQLQHEANLDLCNRCLELMDHKEFQGERDIKKVFISSTSDLKAYREIARKKVEAAHMFPEMYENWVQSGLSPRDVCCQKVLESDVLLVILGSRYGYIEPSWNMSMTEIEYQTALSAGKKILAFIISIQQNDDDSLEMDTMRQRDFINKVKQSRILKIVTDEMTFADSASHDLLTYNK